MARPEDDTSGSDGSESSDSLLREVARIDDSTSAAVPVPRTPGSRIGRFVLRGELGRGGMGVVYRAFDDTLNRSVALKVLPALAGAKADEAKARLLREARAAASLEHQHVVAIYEVGEHEGALFIAMELVVGQTLRARMQEPSILEEKIGWLVEIAEALSAAHDKGIVHRDVKPENVMIKRDGHVKVLDFGIARQSALPIDPSAPTETSEVRLGTLTAEGAVVGTPRYMAPEQLKGDKLDGRCDQFAWGVVAYELFAGKPPWEASDAVSLIASILGKDPPPLREVAPHVPSAIAAVVERALSKSPDDRFGLMRGVVEAMQGSRRATQRPAGSTKESRPSWVLLAAGGVALAIGLALIGTRRFEADAPVAVASVAPAATASASSNQGSGIAITDLPLPHSNFPEALAAYKAGMQAYRDNDDVAAISNFERARKLDPDMGAAYRRGAALGGALVSAEQGLWSDAETVELFRGAAERRSTLPDHEALLLDALLPCAQSRAGSDRWCVERVRALAGQHPRDAEFAYELGVRLSLAGQFRAWLEAARRAIDLDPKFARARVDEILAFEYLGDFAGARKAVGTCLTTFPSIGCLGARGLVEAVLGQGAELEGTANAMLGMSPNDTVGLYTLANGSSCADRPAATVRSALERMVAANPASEQPIARLNADLDVAAARGDFAAARDRNEDRVRLKGASPELGIRGALVWVDSWLAFETGRPDDAAKAARDYLDLQRTLVGSRREDESSLNQHAVWMMLNALRRAGRLSKAQVKVERDRFIADWKPRLGPDYQPYLWLETYAATAEDEADAREALEALASFNGPPKWFGEVPDELYIGRVYMLAGRVDEAIPWLAEAAHACRFADPRVMWANLELGKALEKKHDNDKACGAYAFVLKHWGNAKPKSVTADEAKKRSKALGCPR